MPDPGRAGAREKALALLADTDTTEALLAEKLLRRGFTRGECEDALAYVKSFGYVDDARYADRFIELRREKDSRRKIAADLMERKRLMREAVDAAFERAGFWDEKPLIRRLARKKMSALRGERADCVRKTASHLIRKGFSPSDVLAVLDEERDE